MTDAVPSKSIVLWQTHAKCFFLAHNIHTSEGFNHLAAYHRSFLNSPLNHHTSNQMHVPYLINHLFLPPKLPQEDNSISDDSTSGGPQMLLSYVAKTAGAFIGELKKEHIEANVLQGWTHLQKTLQWMDKLHMQSMLLLENVCRIISGMEVHGALSPLLDVFYLTHFMHTDVFALHISKQNAGVII